MKVEVLSALSISSIIVGSIGAFFYIFLLVFLPWTVFVPVGILIFSLIVIGILGLKRKREILESLKPIQILNEHSDDVIKGFDILLEEVNTYPENEICRISKIKLTDEREVVRCPVCESLFIKEYVIDWVKGSKLCPVCNSLVVSIIVDEKTVDAIPKTLVI